MAEIGELVWVARDGEPVPVVITAVRGKALEVVDPGGRELLLAERRIEHRSDLAVLAAVSTEQAAARAAAHLEAVNEVAAEIAVEVLWELLLSEEGGRDGSTLAALAELAVGETGSVACDAMWLALLRTPRLFKQKGSWWFPQSERVVREQAHADERAAREQRLIGEMAAAIERAAAPPADAAPTGAEEAAQSLREGLQLLEELCLFGDEAPRHARALKVLQALGEKLTGDPRLTAFRILVRCGEMHEDEDLNLRRHKIRGDFPPWVDDEVERIRANDALGTESGRIDLCHLTAVAIDSPWTSEVDDALAVEPRGQETVVHIMISDPASLISRGGPLDDEARRRGATLYHPIGRYLMLPGAISEQLASLSMGDRRPALDFAVTMDSQGQAVGFEIHEAVAKVTRRMSYQDVDALLEANGEASRADEPVAAALKRLLELASLRRARREEAGAFLYDRIEVSVRVTPAGEILLDRARLGTPSHLIVSEMMILACAEAGTYCEKHRIPAVFRTQAPPDDPTEWSPSMAGDTAAVDAALRKLKKAELSLVPRPHHSLGVTSYTQVTSPLRRYQDLVMHRQLRAHLRGLPPPYEDGELMALFAEVEEIAAAHNQIERDAKRYWVLKHLAREEIREVEVIVRREVGRRYLVDLIDYGITAHLSPNGPVTPGERVRVNVTSVSPREDRIVLG